MEEDRVERTAKWVLASAAVGALVPLFWIFISLLAFNARESSGIDVYWTLVYITCPPWWWVATSPMKLCFLNGLLYGLAALAIAYSVNRRRKTPI